jgi:hypothetical protein
MTSDEAPRQRWRPHLQRHHGVDPAFSWKAEGRTTVPMTRRRLVRFLVLWWVVCIGLGLVGGTTRSFFEAREVAAVPLPKRPMHLAQPCPLTLADVARILGQPAPTLEERASPWIRCEFVGAEGAYLALSDAGAPASETMVVGGDAALAMGSLFELAPDFGPDATLVRYDDAVDFDDVATSYGADLTFALDGRVHVLILGSLPTREARDQAIEVASEVFSP